MIQIVDKSKQDSLIICDKDFSSNINIESLALKEFLVDNFYYTNTTFIWNLKRIYFNWIHYCLEMLSNMMIVIQNDKDPINIPRWK